MTARTFGKTLAKAGLVAATIGTGAAAALATKVVTKAAGKAHTVGGGDDEPAVVRTVTIRAAAGELYAFWRDFGNLPKIMENLEAVRPGEGETSEWVVKAPLGQSLTLRTKVSEDVQGELIAWSSTEASDIATQGRVRFLPAPGDRGTRVSLEIDYDSPGGEAGRLFAKLFRREPAIQARHDLKRLKMLFEAGEIATSARQASETRAAKQTEELN